MKMCAHCDCCEKLDEVGDENDDGHEKFDEIGDESVDGYEMSDEIADESDDGYEMNDEMEGKAGIWKHLFQQQVFQGKQDKEDLKIQNLFV